MTHIKIQGDYPVDYSTYKVLKVTDEGVFLLFKYKEIRTVTGGLYGGYWMDFPVFVKHEDLPLPEPESRKVRWAMRIEKRLQEEDLRKKLAGMTVQDYVNSIYSSVIAQRAVEPVIQR
jgi:hypothetical protein